MRFAAAAAIFLSFACPVLAEDANLSDKPPAASPEKQAESAAAAPEAVIGFGVSRPECQEWTDGCVICKRGADVVACSTPGIACQPVAPVCKDPAK